MIHAYYGDGKGKSTAACVPQATVCALCTCSF